METQRHLRAAVLILIAFGAGWQVGGWRAESTAERRWAAALEAERESTREAGRALMRSKPYPEGFVNPESTHYAPDAD